MGYIRNNFKLILIIFLLLFIMFLPFLWIPNGYLINSEDQGFMNYETLLSSSLFSWTNRFAYGIAAGPATHSLILPAGIFYYFFHNILGLDNSLVQRMYISFCIFLVFISFYLFSTLFTKRKDIFLLAALIYFLNFYVANSFTYTAKIFQIILMPLLFFLTYRYLQTESKKYIAYNFIFIFLFQGIFTNLPQVIATFLSYFLAVSFFKLINRAASYKRILYKLIPFFMVIFPVVVYQSLVHFYSLYEGLIKMVKDGNFFTAIDSEFNKIFLFRGAWWEYQGQGDVSYNHWLNFYDNKFILLISFILVILILYFGFIKIKKYKKKKIFWLFCLLFFIILSSGKVFRSITYKTIEEIIPFFAIFREPWAKFMPLVIFSFSALAILVLEGIKNRKYFKWIYIILFSITLVKGYPFFSKNFYEKNKSFAQTFIKPPGYWWEYKKWTTSVKDKKLLPIPYLDNPFDWKYNWYDDNNIGNYNFPLAFIFSSSNVFSANSNYKPSVIVNNFLKKRSFDFIKLGKVDYVLMQNDIKYIPTKEYLYSWQKNSIKKYISDAPIMKFSDKLFLYKINNEYFLPHFYIPQNVIYSNGEIEDLADVVSFDDYSIRSGIYLDGSKEEKEEDGNLLKRANEFFVEGKLENRVSEGWLKDTAVIDVEDIFFPYVRWKPGSLIYALILKKEQFDEWKVRKSTEKLLDKKLFYASKRISEIEKWERETDLDKAFEEYGSKMKEAIELLKEDSWQNERDLQQNILKTEVYLKAHWGKIVEIGLDEERTEEAKEIFEKLQEKLENLKPKDDSSILVYNFEIPKEENYQLFIKNEEFSRYLRDIQLELEILGEKRTIPLLSETETWISGGNFKLEKGEQELRLDIPQAINLLGRDEWQSNLTESIFVKNEMITSPNLQLAFTEDSTLYFKTIENYQGDAFYKISFDYFASGGEAGIVLIEDIGIKKRELMIKQKLSATSPDLPRHFEKIFKSTPGAETSEFYFWGKKEFNYWEKIEGKEESKINFTNVKIEKVFEPTIILHTTQFQKPPQMPKITFIKINPTKYKVKVEGAKEPYTLVFSESFHQGWKAYISDQQSVTSDQYGEVVASYFNGEIEEGTHRNIFLDGNTFETLGKKSLSEDKHLLVNGYANSWYITSENSGGKENYEIIIEFWPQRLFYLGLGISLMTLLSCMGYLGYDLTKRKIEKNEKS